MSTVTLDIVDAWFKRDGKVITIEYRFRNKRDADRLEKQWQTAEERARCPSCRILWEQAWDMEGRHHEDCQWPEMLIERKEKQIKALQAKIAELKTK